MADSEAIERLARVQGLMNDKSRYLAALLEHGLVKDACETTGISVGQVWEWRETDTLFNEEFKRIWLKESEGRR
jgi:hypothetical protein